MATCICDLTAQATAAAPAAAANKSRQATPRQQLCRPDIEEPLHADQCAALKASVASTITRTAPSR